MIDKFVKAFDANRENLLAGFKVKHVDSYQDIVKAVITVLAETEEYGGPDPERIHLIDDGDYQGTLLFIIAAKGYQPSTYWAVKVGYGSCSGCDTLQAIRNYNDEPPTDEEAKEYLTLALHIVQGLKEIGEE